MPELKRGRGYSHWNPGNKDEYSQVSQRKLIGTPRIFPSRQAAHRSIVQWNALPNSYNGYRSGPFGDDDYQIQIRDDGRKKEDLEIVEVELVVKEPIK